MPDHRHNRPPISYRDAGVDIDAGNALVEAIKPLAKATRRPGADADLGGFGGLFDLKAAGFKDPILVAANDGVGTKLKIAIETGQHATIGIDLVAMCVNDLLVQGAEPLFFLDYFASGKLDVATAREVIAGIAEGCHAGGLRADRRRDGRDAGHVCRRRLRSRGLRRRRGRARRAAAAPRHRRRRRADRACRPRACIPTATRWCAGWWRRRSSTGTRRRRSRPQRSLAEALLTPTRIYVKPVLAPCGDRRRDRRRDQGAGAHHRRRLVGEPAARAAGRPRRAHRPRARGRRLPCSAG